MLNRAALIYGLTAAVAPLTSFAADTDSRFRPIDFQLRLETGVQYYRFIQDGLRLNIEEFNPELNVMTTTLVASESLEFSSTQALFGAGATVFIGDFFVDLSGIGTVSNDDTTDQDIDITVQVPGPNDVPISVLEEPVGAKHDSEGRQEDYAVSLGYSINDRFVVYAGYKWGEVNSSDSVSLNSPTLFSDTALDIDFDFDRRGPFIGATYGWPITRGALDGVLSFNAAAAFLDGELDFQVDSALDESADNDILVGSFFNVSSKGDTVGLTLGITWTGRTGVEGLAYSLAVSGYSYDYDADTEQGGSADFREQAVSFKAGLNYIF